MATLTAMIISSLGYMVPRVPLVATLTAAATASLVSRMRPMPFVATLCCMSCPVFSWLAKTGGVIEAEMLRTFNCGIGMVLVVEPAAAEALTHDLVALGEQVVRIGEIIAAPQEPLVRPFGALGL